MLPAALALLAPAVLAQAEPPTIDVPPLPVAEEQPVEVVAPPVDKAIETGAKAKRDSALIIGNETYDNLPDAPFARHDASAVYEHLRYTRGLSSYRLRTLNDVNARDIKRGLRRARGRVWRNGTLWIYFSGHCATTPDGRRVLLGADQSADEDQLAETGYPLDELVAYATKTKARQVIVVLDASFGLQGRDGSYPIVGRDALSPAPFAGVDNTNLTVWVATTGNEIAGSYEPVRHGLFTWSMLGALRGWADGAEGDMPDGMVTLSEAQTYVSDITRHLGRIQVPYREQREEVAGWVLAEFDGMETGLSPDALDTLADRERSTLMANIMAEAHERSEVDWKRVQAIARTGSPEGEQALRDYVRDWEFPILSIEWVQYVPWVREAQRMADHYDEIKAQVAEPPPEEPAIIDATPGDGQASADTGDTAEPDPPGPQQVQAEIKLDDSCDDLLKLQDQALAGILREGQLACLEDRIVTDKLMTDKDKVSRVLLVDAEVKKDLVRWEALMERHLTQIDQSDPDLCFKYTIYISKKGGDNAAEVIDWSTRALERKDRWSGRLYEKKVFALHRLRAEAAMTLWQQAEQKYLQERTLQAEDASNQVRGQAKEFSRAWLDYARASDQETDTALRMCLSAAGAMDFCEAQ